MYVVLRTLSDLKYAVAAFVTKDEQDAKSFAEIMARNDEGYSYIVTKTL